MPVSSVYASPPQGTSPSLFAAGPTDDQLLLTVASVVTSPSVSGWVGRVRRACAAYRSGRATRLSPSRAARKACRAACRNGPFLSLRLSTVVEHVCEAYCQASTAAERTRRLQLALAGFLNERRVLRFGQVSPAGLDDWAATAPVIFVRAAVRACAGCAGGVR